MTVKVLSAPKVHNCTCGRCGCDLEYGILDVKSKIDRDYTGCGEKVNYITCPTCMSHVAVKQQALH